MYGINNRAMEYPEAITIPSCHQIWAKKLYDGTIASVFVNYDILPTNITCDETCFSTMGLTGKVSILNIKTAS